MEKAEKTIQLRTWDENHKLYASHQDEIAKIIDVVKNDSDLLFLIRRDCVTVYYLGTVILEYSGNKFGFNRNYLGKFADSVPKHFDSFESWKNNLPLLKQAMANYNGPKTAEKTKGEQREKRVQQDIVRRVNNNPNSRYYILDMEYAVPKCSFGRADMIAVSKFPINGKHKIALIEFKYGRDAFGVSKSASNPYGSGITGHAYNMNRFISSELTKDLAIELESMSKACKEFKLPPSAYLPEIASANFDITDIKTWLLCVGCEDVIATEDSVLRYLGYPRKGCAARDNVRGAVSSDFVFAYQITDAEYVDSLSENDFFHPTI